MTRNIVKHMKLVNNNVKGKLKAGFPNGWRRFVPLVRRGSLQTPLQIYNYKYSYVCTSIPTAGIVNQHASCLRLLAVNRFGAIAQWQGIWIE